MLHIPPIQLAWAKGNMMMPVIRLNDATFVDLKSISTWIGTKTPSETIVQLVEEKMAALDLERDVELEHASQEGLADHLAFDKAPGLSFTKILSAKVDGEALRKPNWVGVLLAVIRALKAKGISGQKLVNELQVPAKTSVYEVDGFRFHPDLGLSVQGRSAQEAWKEASRIADKYRFPVEITFKWRENEKAQHPGRTGLIRAGE